MWGRHRSGSFAKIFQIQPKVPNPQPQNRKKRGVEQFFLIQNTELGRRERFRIFAHPTRMYFADAMGEDAKVMKMIGGWVSKAEDFLIFAGTYLHLREI